MSQLETPVAFFAFNRPDTTEIVLNAIRKAQPKQLFIVLDGPRQNHPTDIERTGKVRQIIESSIDWPCQIERDYSVENLGCGRRVSSGLDWVFSKTEQAIILEDDCLPSPSFFQFCEELLARYAEDQNVMQIAGSNLIESLPKSKDSYFFSRNGGIWGWASWRRAWERYDFTLRDFAKTETLQNALRQITNPIERQIRKKLFKACYHNAIDTWDYQWLFAKLTHCGSTITPFVNLVENIGFGHDATHTTSQSNPFHKSAFDIEFPLSHPNSTKTNEAFDEMYFQQFYLRNMSLAHRAALRLEALFSK